MARRKDEAPEETPQAPEETQNAENQAADADAAAETAPGDPGDVIDARLEMQEQGDDALDLDDDAAAGNGGDDIDKEAEGEAQHANVTGVARSGRAHIGGPTQDELNPAYAAPTKSE